MHIFLIEWINGRATGFSRGFCIHVQLLYTGRRHGQATVEVLKPGQSSMWWYDSGTMPSHCNGRIFLHLQKVWDYKKLSGMSRVGERGNERPVRVRFRFGKVRNSDRNHHTEARMCTTVATQGRVFIQENNSAPERLSFVCHFKFLYGSKNMKNKQFVIFIPINNSVRCYFIQLFLIAH